MIVSLFTGGIVFILKWERFCQFASKKWNNKWKTGISVFSQFFLVMLVIDETGLLLNEWGNPSSFFTFFRSIMELPGITQIIFLANLALVVPAGYSLSTGILLQIRENNEQYITDWKDFKKYSVRYSTAISLFLLIVSLFFFLFQCLVFGEFNIDGGNGIIFMIFLILIMSGPIIMLFRIMPVILRISRENNPFRRQPWYEREDMFFTLLVCFISLAQTMITKVILLLAVAGWSKPLLRRLISKLTMRHNNKSTSGKENAYESLINGLSSSTLIQKWNFIFFTASFIPLILVFQIHNSPYSPSDSAFPKTETISALYMFYMIMFLFISQTRKHIRLKSIVWFICTIFIIYLTPVFFPSWYFPSVVPPGFSPLEGIGMLSSVFAASCFFLFVHLTVSLSFLLSYYSISLKQKLIDLKYISSSIFKRYFLLGIISSYFLIIVFPVLILIISTSPAFRSMRFMSVNSIFPTADTNILMEVMVILLPTMLIFSVIPGIKKNIRGMKKSALEFGGGEAVEFLENNFKYLKCLKDWTGKKNSLQSFYIYGLPLLIFILFSSFLFYLPDMVHRKRTEVIWSVGNNNENMRSSGRIIKVDENIIYITSVSLRSYNSTTGELDWQSKLNPFDASLVDGNELCLLTARDILLINPQTGEQLWKNQYSPKEPVLPDYPQLLNAGNDLAIKLKDTLSVYSKFSGEKLGGPFVMKGPTPVILGGGLIWITDSDSLVKWDQHGGYKKLLLVEDSIRDLISLPGHAFVIKGQRITSINVAGKREWSKNIEQNEYVNDVFISDSLAIFDLTQGLVACSVINGSTIWERPGLHFGNLNYDMFSGNKYANIFNKLNDYIIAANGKDVYMLETSHGNSIREFIGAKKANPFFDNYSVGISDNVMCTFDPIKTEMFSLDNQRIIFWDFYVKDVISKRPLFFHNNSSGLTASGIIFENDTIFLSNDYGLFALKLKR
jgi:outer membrane protein assembly factor BamB